MFLANSGCALSKVGGWRPAFRSSILPQSGTGWNNAILYYTFKIGVHLGPNEQSWPPQVNVNPSGARGLPQGSIRMWISRAQSARHWSGRPACGPNSQIAIILKLPRIVPPMEGEGCTDLIRFTAVDSPHRFTAPIYFGLTQRSITNWNHGIIGHV